MGCGIRRRRRRSRRRRRRRRRRPDGRVGGRWRCAGSAGPGACSAPERRGRRWGRRRLRTLSDLPQSIRRSISSRWNSFSPKPATDWRTDPQPPAGFFIFRVLFFVLFCFGRADVDVKEENGRYRTEKSTCPRHPSSSETPSAVRVVWRPIVGARPLCRTGSSIVSSFLFSFLQYFFSKYFLLDCLVAISSLVRRLLAAFFFLVAVARKWWT